jgi:hypothetical protein
MGLLTAEEVEQILEVQKQTRQLFGQIAVQMGLVTAEQVWSAWAKQMSYRRRFVELNEVGIDTAAVKRVTVPTARALGVVPLRLWGDHLIVAGSPDVPTSALTELAEHIHCRVQACMAFPESVRYHLDRLEDNLETTEPSSQALPA